MKKIIHIVFGVIIVLTILASIIEGLTMGADTHMENFDKALGTVFSLMFTVILLIVELGLYYNCIYFFAKKNKKVWKTFYNVIMLIVSCIIIVSLYGMWFWTYQIWSTVVLIMVFASIVLWGIYALLCMKEMLASQ